jgi:hypothetical protein
MNIMSQELLIPRYQVLKQLMQGMARRVKILNAELGTVDLLESRLKQSNIDVPSNIMGTINSYGKKIASALQDIKDIDSFLVERAKVLAIDIQKAKAELKAAVKKCPPCP